MKKVSDFAAKNSDEIVSISSLESPEHAKNIDPKILTVYWMIGKRCNYDCSYCPSWSHDSFSPHLSTNSIKNTINNISSRTIKEDKQFKIFFTGGEPFIHPDFLDILKNLNEKPNLYTVGVVTNGSAELTKYIKASEHLSNLTVSLHLEQTDSIIENTIEKIIYLNNNTDMFINVNIMAATGKVKIIPNIVNTFCNENIKFTINKIKLAETDTGHDKKVTRSEYKKDKKYFDIKNKIEKTKDRLDLTTEKVDNYYTVEELKIIEKNQNLMEWQDTKVYYKSYTEEKNSLALANDGLTNFLGWHCYAGIDTIYIDYDGSIYRAHCYADGAIGHIDALDIDWPINAVTCPHNICSCNSDIRIRKAKNTRYLNNISNV